MKAVVIGGCGHIGTYLVPRLVEYGYEVVSISRGQREPYTKSGMWNWVEKIQIDRQQEEADGTFGKKIADLKPDVVVDLIAFKPESVEKMVSALEGKIEHYLYCSSVWAQGHAMDIPGHEDNPLHPFGEYGTDKAKTEAFLLKQHRMKGFPATMVRPGHITGPGWNFINPCGNLDPLVFEKIAKGEKIYIANFGMEGLHNVHADDVAQVFHKAILHRNQALGESFFAVAPEATTMRGIAEKMFMWFGKEPNIEYLPWKEWKEQIKDSGFITSTENHVLHSDAHSIEKAKRLIGYQPRYTIFQAMCEGVVSMIDRGVINVK